MVYVGQRALSEHSRDFLCLFQYPKGLGETVKDLDISHAKGPFSKTKFSMVIPAVEEQLSKLPTLTTVVLFGVEVKDSGQWISLQLLQLLQLLQICLKWHFEFNAIKFWTSPTC